MGGGRPRPVGEGNELKNILQSFFQTQSATPAPVGNRASTLQALLLMSSKAVNDRVLAQNGSRVQKLLESGKTRRPDHRGAVPVESVPVAHAGREGGRARSTWARIERPGRENLQWVLAEQPGIRV